MFRAYYVLTRFTPESPYTAVSREPRVNTIRPRPACFARTFARSSDRVFPRFPVEAFPGSPSFSPRPWAPSPL